MFAQKDDICHLWYIFNWDVRFFYVTSEHRKHEWIQEWTFTHFSTNILSTDVLDEYLQIVITTHFHFSLSDFWLILDKAL